MTPNDRTEFSAAMGKCAIATRSELTDADMLVYWTKFTTWELSDFQEALRRCSDELNRFPTVHQIRQAFPKRLPTVDEIINKRDAYQPLISITEDRSERGTDDLEAKIDSLTNNDLMILFETLHDNVDYPQQAAAFSVRQFRKNPNGRLYRGLVRDLVRGEVRKQT
jgi:hypothetical protein